MLVPTPAHSLTDSHGRPYFLWDCELRLDQLLERLADEDDDVRAYWLGKTLRQARPDDAVTLLDMAEVRRLWPRIEPNLGHTREFWSWLLWDRWGRRAG